MKKILCLFAFVLTTGLISAQDAAPKKSCAKTCAKTCTKSASASADAQTRVASALSAADIAAEENENIERKVCELSGNVSYFEKSVCAHSGSVKMTEVEWDETSEAFVNVSPKDVMADQEAKVVKAAAKSADAKAKKKACCAGKKACTKKEGA